MQRTCPIKAYCEILKAALTLISLLGVVAPTPISDELRSADQRSDARWCNTPYSIIRNIPVQ